jgi:hypothetical protein
MMQRLFVGGWEIDHDPAATSKAYEQSGLTGPEKCGCLYCRNFIAARGTAYPSALRELFHRLGLESPRESEIWEFGFEPGQDRLYGGFFHIIGSIVKAAEPVEGEPFYFSARRDLLPSGFPQGPILQVEFQFRVPWVLEEAPTDVATT